MIPRVKICCISSVSEARMAIQAGASALGLVGDMPGGPGVISDRLIKDIALTVPPPIATFLLTSEMDASMVIAHHKKVHTNTIQLVDRLQTGTYQQIREALPSVKLVQVIHVLDKKSVDEAIHKSQFVDALLLDSGNPNLKTKILGGTGRTHNWKLSRKIRLAIDKPVFLAGGISSENVKEAIETVNPFGIDLCSSVRTKGKLDQKKLDVLFKAIY